MRRVCIAIGVSRAEGLAPLRAAATAAEEIGQWAELSGFAMPEDIRVLTDRKAPVTTELIAETFEQLLPMGRQTDALLIHFAGHGLREDNTRTLWLPTNWRTKLRAIAVERLKNRLSDFGIANVTIISDACKALANDKDTSDLTPDGILGAGTSAGSRPIFDRFDAVHDIESAFMIPGPTPAESRCLFSGALIEALWGATSAIDAHYAGKVTPGSLADYLSARVAELCETYQLSCEPQTLPGRPPDHLIYFDKSKVDASIIPALPAWPAPIRVAAITPTGAQHQTEDKGAFDEDFDLSIEGEPIIALGTGRIDGVDQHAKIVRSILGSKLGDTNPDITEFERQFQLSDATRTKLNFWVRTIAKTSSEGLNASSQAGLSWLRAKARGEVERSLVADYKEERRSAAANAFLQTLIPEPNKANLLFGGGKASAIWSRAPVRRVADDQWLAEIEGESQQLVVEYGDGVFLPLVVYHGLATIAARDARGTYGWMFGSYSEHGDPVDQAVDILIRMQSGDLPPSQVDEVAAVLRSKKHGNPVLGAICSYLYDYTGDLDGIRRMAFFYASCGQPIPYDIALMGELVAHLDGSAYATEVPAVGPRSRIGPGLPDFVTTATDQKVGSIGGLCPWLRQGWDFVDAPTDRETPLVRNLPDIRNHLLPETFTSFDRQGGRMLTRHWGMRLWR
jgi:hypothetical protein